MIKKKTSLIIIKINLKSFTDLIIHYTSYATRQKLSMDVIKKISDGLISII